MRLRGRLAALGLAVAMPMLPAPASGQQDAVGIARPGKTHAGEPESSTQVRYHMGTLWTVQARGPDAFTAVESAFAEIGRIDRLLSTYRPDSELSRINREAGKAWVIASPETRGIIERALGYARMSGGAFDPTVGPLVKLWGFKHLDYRFPTETAILQAKAKVGHAQVETDEAKGIRYRRAGIEIDLGAIAKGYAVDRALDKLRERGATMARVDAGGNQRVWGASAAGKNWVFGIKHPRNAGDVLGWTEIEAGGISTSGDSERGFWKDGIRYGHLIDPRAGRPAQGVLSVTVVARDAETADAWSTLLYVLGPEAGMKLLGQHAGVEALWVLAGSASEPYITLGSKGFRWKPAAGHGRVKLDG